jgi:hypothetical protein
MYCTRKGSSSSWKRELKLEPTCGLQLSNSLLKCLRCDVEFNDAVEWRVSLVDKDLAASTQGIHKIHVGEIVLKQIYNNEPDPCVYFAIYH